MNNYRHSIRALSVLCGLSAIAVGSPIEAQAQALGSLPSGGTTAIPYAQKTPYEKRHSHTPGKGTFYKDPNIWVITPQFAELTGMPKEWISTELQGAEAVAFRYESQGAEEECGWMGDPKRCTPIFHCVMELYFDETKHKLPWDTGQPSWYDSSHSSIRHMGAMSWMAPNSEEKMQEEIRRRLKLMSPFSNSTTGKELRFNNVRAKAYDRALHGTLSFLKLDLGGCHGLYRIMPKPGEGHILELKEACDLDCIQNPPSKVIHHRVVLPHEWRVRVATLLKFDAERWRKMTSEAVEKVLEENRK